MNGPQGKLNVMNNVEESPNELETEETSFLQDDTDVIR